jgi:hypothetical protein
MVRIRPSAALTGAALLALSGSAEADPTLTERLRLQGGYFTEQRPAPQPRIESFNLTAMPELGLFWGWDTSRLSVTYQLTGALNTQGGQSELANRLILASQFDLSRRTQLLLQADAAETSLSNFLVTNPSSTSTVTLFPSVANRVVTVHAAEGLTHELSQRVRLTEGADVGYTTSIAPSPPLDSIFANVTVGADHSWESDSLGGLVRAGYANTHAPPPITSQQYVTLTAAPQWRRDWSRSFSTQAAAGASVVLAVSGGGDPLVTPFGQASALYLVNETTLALTYSAGVTPNPLTGQTIRSNQVMASIAMPISASDHLSLGASAGYLRGAIIDLAIPANNQDYDSFMSDVSLNWQVSPLVGLFARYQFIAQIGDENALGFNPSFLRDFGLVGVQLSSRPSGGEAVQTRFPARVDGSDTRASGSNDSSGASSDGDTKAEPNP